MYNFNFVTAQGKSVETITAPNLVKALDTLCVLRGHDGYITNVREKGFSSDVYKVIYYLSTYIDFEVTYTKEVSVEVEEIVVGEFI
jgi:hypothetical protein